MKSPANVWFLAAVVASFSGATLSAHATLVTYSNKAAFLADSGSTDASGAYANLGYVGSAPKTFGSVRVGGVSPMWVGALGYQADWTPLLPGNDLAFDGKENFDVVTAAPVYSLGFDVVEPTFVGINGGCGTGVPSCTDSTFTVTLLDSASVVVGSFTFNPANDVAASIGVTSTTAFSKAQVRETVGNIENEYFGHFYTSEASVTSVPEPSTNALFLAGLAGAAVWARRRLKTASVHAD